MIDWYYAHVTDYMRWIQSPDYEAYAGAGELAMFATNLDRAQNKILNEHERQLKAGALARGLSMARWLWARRGLLGLKTFGLEFRDRLGRYGCLSVWDMFEEPTAGIWAMLDDRGLDVRLNRDIKPHKRQLSLML